MWTFLLPLSLNVLRHKERGTIFLFWLFHLPPPPTRVAPAEKSPRASESQPCSVSSSQLTDFFKISQNPPRAWRHSPCVTLFPISGYCDISEWHVRFVCARENLFYCCTQLTHAPSRKILSLTKPKGINRTPSAIILHSLAIKKYRSLNPIYIYIYIYIPLSVSRMPLKVNFLAEFNRFEFSFHSPSSDTIPGLKTLVCPTIYQVGK